MQVFGEETLGSPWDFPILGLWHIFFGEFPQTATAKKALFLSLW